MAVEKMFFFLVFFWFSSLFIGPFFKFRIPIPYEGSKCAILSCRVLVRPYCHGVVEVNRLWPPLSRNYVAMEKGNVDATRSVQDKPSTYVIICLLHYAHAIHLLPP